MKRRPYFCIAGAALPPISHTRYSMSKIVSQAKAKVNPRKERSRNRSSIEGGLERDVDVGASWTNAGDFMPSCFYLEARGGRFIECSAPPWRLSRRHYPAEGCSPFQHSPSDLR